MVGVRTHVKDVVGTGGVCVCVCVCAPLHSAQCSEPVADVTLFRRNKSPKIHQPRFEGSSGLLLATVPFYDRAKL